MRPKRASLIVLGLALAVILLQTPAARAQSDTAALQAGTLYENSVRSADGSYMSAAVDWSRMPTKGGLPAQNADRTFYAGDGLALRVQGSRTDIYDRVRVSGVVVEGTRDVDPSLNWDGMSTHDVWISGDARAGVGSVRVELLPRKAKVIVETFIRLSYGVGQAAAFSARRLDGISADGAQTEQLVDSGTYELTLGAVTGLSSGGNVPPYRTPPPRQINVHWGGTYHIRAFYVDENLGIAPYYEVFESEPTGAADPVGPIAAELRIRIVTYDPSFSVLDYPWTNWAVGTKVMEHITAGLEFPMVVLVRYDGNRYDPENASRLSLGQRALVNAIAAGGVLARPVIATERKPQTHDNYPGKFAPAALTIVTRAGRWGLAPSIPGKIYVDGKLLGTERVELRVAAGVHTLHFEDWFGLPPTLPSGGRPADTERRWRAPPDIYLVALPGSSCEVWGLFTENGTSLNEPSSSSTYPYRFFNTPPEYGRADSPPADPFESYYRHDDAGNRQYYQPGDFEISDSGTIKLETVLLENYMTGIRFPLPDQGGYFGKTRSSYNRLDFAQAVLTVTEPQSLLLREKQQYSSDPVSFSSPIQFDKLNRRARFVFNFYPLAYSPSAAYGYTYERFGYDWFENGGSATFGLNLLWTGDGGERTSVQMGLYWDQVGLTQPIAVRAWKLKNAVREGLDEQPRKIMEADSWELDDISIRATFTPLVKLQENFLDNEELFEFGMKALDYISENVATETSPAWEELGVPSFSVRGTTPRPSATMPDLEMIKSFFAEALIEGENDQMLSGRGTASGVLQSGGSNVFYVTIDLPDNKSARRLVTLDFDPRTTASMDVSATGGFAVEKLEQPWRATLRILCPPQGGKIRRIAITDNAGNLILDRSYPEAMDFLSLYAGASSGLAESGEVELTIYRTSNTPRLLKITVVNESGAVNVMSIELIPYASEPVVNFWASVSALMLAAAAAFAWMLISKHIGLSRPRPGEDVAE